MLFEGCEWGWKKVTIYETTEYHIESCPIDMNEINGKGFMNKEILKKPK